ncbi:sulfotransferase [Mangrovimonas sp. CR14]|uniref:sulfotransferase domain-containing protein n=1 Tax=Mangrovimonas sp. CR14 TaxID=2706120 RepID=UPI00141FEF5D|nr:sulfotransferase domain-containing protein [Mangrovimonas sp. CR14]NIK91374.1 sulfotransferase [Mangrovimonas sp. CR14]
MKKIAIHSVPRSGSSWLGSILDSSPYVAYRFQPLFSFGHKGQLTPESTTSDIDNFFVDILHTNDKFVLQKEGVAKDIDLKFKKQEITHIVYKEVRYHHILKNLLEKDKEVKVIGLIRNPMAVINSWLKAPKEFRREKNWKELEEWRYANLKNLNKVEEFNGYEKWKEVAELFLSLNAKYPNRFLLVHYSDLLKNEKQMVKEIFDFCELNMEAQTYDFIKDSRLQNNEDAYSVFKTKRSDSKWQKELNPLILNEIKNDLKHTHLEGFLEK